MCSATRVVQLCVLALASTTALAEPLRLAPFSNHCFDAGQLAARVKTRGLRIVVAPHSGQAGQEVEVSGGDPVLEVRIVARDADGRVVGTESRRIPDGPCESLLETSELIVARAATPLHFLPEEPKPKPRLHRREPESLGAKQPETQLQSEGEPEPVVDVIVPQPPVIRERVIVVQEATPKTPRPPLRVELSLHGLWVFPLDHAPSALAGDLEVAVRWSKRLGVGLRAGIANRWRSFDRSGDSAAALDVRRVPLALLLEAELQLPPGVIRLGAGPLVNLWRVDSIGVSQPGIAWLAQPAVQVRAAYRYAIRRWFVEAGVDLGIALLQQSLVVTGAGALSHTPLFDLSPFLGLGVNPSN